MSFIFQYFNPNSPVFNYAWKRQINAFLHIILNNIKTGVQFRLWKSLLLLEKNNSYQNQTILPESRSCEVIFNM